ncbi:MAG: hypothetical protein Q4E50_05640 [Tissierellia bacterium]|nr:hypothetical protein [Tissierellia bacterium]
MNRPVFEQINNYDEFSKYFWYKEELALICSKLTLDPSGSKEELEEEIKEYFDNRLTV